MSSESASAVGPTTADSGARSGVVRRILTNPFGAVPIGAIMLIALLAVFANVLSPFDPAYVRLDLANHPPFTSDFFLGGDAAGRDVLSRLLVAGRLTLLGALITVVVAAGLGVTTGLIAGYFGGPFDASTSWVSDVVLVLPTKIVLVALFAVIGPNTLVTMAVLGIMLAPGFFRLVRNLVIGVKGELYIDAARVSGLSDARIIGRHVLSVVRAPLIILAAGTAGIAVVIQAGLEFIGLGDPSSPTWGGMLQDAFLALYKSPTLLIWPAVMIGVFVASCVLLGNAVRDALEDGAVAPAPKRMRAPSTAAIRIPASAVPPTAREASVDALLVVDDLSVGYAQSDGSVRTVVDAISFHIDRGEVLGLVGESGSGKSQTAFSILGLLPSGGIMTTGEMSFDGILLDREGKGSAALRGRRIAYVPQEPMSNLDPAFKIGFQLTEPLVEVNRLSRRDARRRAIELLTQVGIHDPERVFDAYPHEISGGMAQRVLIAGAIACEPDLIIADEPTTALDVTVQAEILDILRRLQRERGMAVLIVTHNFGVVADLCDRVAVMQLGRIVESGGVEQIFDDPQHEYTRMLLASMLEGGPARIDPQDLRADATESAS